MHFNTKLAYTKLFPEIDLSKEELSLSDLHMIVNHFFKNVNTESKVINDFLLSLDRDFKPTQYYKKAIALFLNPSKKATGSEASIEYWTRRGWSVEIAKEEVSKSQRLKSRRCEEYWLARGYTLEESKKRISEVQRNSANKSNAVFDINYWLEKGFDKDEALEKVEEAKIKRSSRHIGFWVERGYSEEESRDIISKNARNTALETLIERYGEEEGRKRKAEIESKRHKFGFGENNPQYGKPSPKASGASVSGTYKTYYFRSLLEYFTIKHLEKTNTHFVCNDVSADKNDVKVIIPYVDLDGKNRNYIPDFLVNETEIWEVKNAYFLQKEDVQHKMNSALEYINRDINLTSLRIITEADIEMCVDELLDDFINGLVVIDKGKLNRFYKRIGKINESYLKEKIRNNTKKSV